MSRREQKDRERKRAAKSSLSATASSLLGLVPAIICTHHLDTTEIVSMYTEDLPSPELVDQEVTRWKLKYDRVPESQRPNTPASSLKECDRDMYPNLHVLLQLACTLPVTSCECKRSASALRRLNNYMRASMGLQQNSAVLPGSTVHVRAGEDAVLQCPLLDGSSTSARAQVGPQTTRPTVSWYRVSAGRAPELLVSSGAADGSTVRYGDGVGPGKVSTGPDGSLRLRGSDWSDAAVYYCGISLGSDQNQDPEPQSHTGN